MNVTAMQVCRGGGLDKIARIELPSRPPAAGEVRVRVHASSLNFHDYAVVSGLTGPSADRIPLSDGAGVVLEVGPGVTGLEAGDHVVSTFFPGWPDGRPTVDGFDTVPGDGIDGFARTEVTMPAAAFTRAPDRYSHTEASTLTTAGVTAWRALFTEGNLRPGETVLVQGTGGVSIFALQFAKLVGATVIATTSTANKEARLKQLGADHVINYRETDFSKRAIAQYGKPQRRTNEGGVDVVVNFTGGDTWVPSLKCLKRGGTLLVCGATAGHDPKEDLRYVWSFELNIKGSNSFYDDNLKALLDLVAEGRISPLIDRRLPLEQAADGLALIRDREVLGKVIVNP